MGLFKKKQKGRPFLQPYGISNYGCKFGGPSQKISEGYNISKLTDYPFVYWIRMNVSRDRIFPLFLELTKILGRPSKCILENHKHEPHKDFSSFLTPIDIPLETFKKYSFQLVNDGFSGFGFSSTKIEFIVEQHKSSHVYCNSLKEVNCILEKFEIPELKKLKTIGELPHAHVDIGGILCVPELMSLSVPAPQIEIDKYNADPDSYQDYMKNIVRDLNLKLETG